MKSHLLIAHPGKHHVLHLVAGCIKSGATVQYVTPFYRKGLGSLVARLPGQIGKKASGYYHPGIPNSVIDSPISMQIRKIGAMSRKALSYEHDFDKYVARQIKKGIYTAEVLVTLQDYMPLTVKAAKEKGFRIWSDQILNQSEETATRIAAHEKTLQLNLVRKHNENLNTEIIRAADLITAPSLYTLEGLKSRLSLTTKCFMVPYGAANTSTHKPKTESSEEILVLARAHSVRKGGHLLLAAIQKVGDLLATKSFPRKVRFVILGEMDRALFPLSNKIVLPKHVLLEHGDIPHSDVFSLYHKASLFIMPSLSESMSLACIEAMNAALPLIITPYCGIDNFLDREMGMLISDDEQSQSHALITAFDNESLWHEWGQYSKALAEHLS